MRRSQAACANAAEPIYPPGNGASTVGAWHVLQRLRDCCRGKFHRTGNGAGARSSAGEHYVDIVGVTGSIPVAPTIPTFKLTSRKAHDRGLNRREDLAPVSPQSRLNDAGVVRSAVSEVFGVFRCSANVQSEHPNNVADLQAHDRKGGLKKHNLERALRMCWVDQNKNDGKQNAGISAGHRKNFPMIIPNRTLPMASAPIYASQNMYGRGGVRFLQFDLNLIILHCDII